MRPTPQYINVSIPYSQAFSVSKICSSNKDFGAHICRMKKWFLIKGYPDKVLNDQIDKVVFGKNPPVKKSSESGIPFVATCHPEVKDLGKLFKYLFPFLYSNEEVNKIYSLSQIVSNRRARKTKDYIVRFKLYPVESSVGCGGYGGSW